MEAFAHFHLTPTEFGKLTPVDYQIMTDGYVKREEKRIKDEAINALMMRRALNEKRMSLSKLLGHPDQVSREEHERRFKEAREKMGAEAIPVKRRR